MVWRYIILLFTALFTWSCAAEPAGEVVWLSYHEYSAAVYATVHYDFQQEEDGRYTLINCANRSPEEALIAIVPAGVAMRLKQIVSEEKMHRYKEEYRPLADVRDGNSWTLTVQFDDGQTLSSSGYARRPRGNGLQRLEDCLNEVWEQAKDSAVTVNLYEKY